MSYTAGFSVNVGDPTKASDVSTLAANDDFLKAITDALLPSTGNLTVYNATNNADTTISLGTSATNRLLVTTDIATGSQELDAVTFSSVTAASGADKGKFVFAVDEVAIATIDDDGIDVASGKTFSINGTDVGGLYKDWSIKTTTYTAVSGDQLICNHASTAFTITLPSSPSVGDTVTLKNVGSATVTVGRNSQKINTKTEDGTLLEGLAVQLVYVDSTIGWTTL
tara:strand:+ start:539 stop:1213 length:675 start_codon:yes stop_codon:yes gene_type:complete